MNTEEILKKQIQELEKLIQLKDRRIHELEKHKLVHPLSYSYGSSSMIPGQSTTGVSYSACVSPGIPTIGYMGPPLTQD